MGLIPLFVGCTKQEEPKPADPPQVQTMEQKYSQQEASKERTEQTNAERGAVYRRVARQFKCGSITYLTFVGNYAMSGAVFDPLTLYDKDASLGPRMDEELKPLAKAGDIVSFSDKYWVYQFNTKTNDLYKQGIVKGKVIDEVVKEPCELIKAGEKIAQ